MRVQALVLSSVALFGSPASLAQKLIVAVSPADRVEVQLYAEPSRQTPATAVLASTLVLPLPVLETRNGLHRIELNGVTSWVSSMQVRLRQDSTASCALNSVPNASGGQTISTPGISASACR